MKIMKVKKMIIRKRRIQMIQRNKKSSMTNKRLAWMKTKNLNTQIVNQEVKKYHLQNKKVHQIIISHQTPVRKREVQLTILTTTQILKTNQVKKKKEIIKVITTHLRSEERRVGKDCR